MAMWEALGDVLNCYFLVLSSRLVVDNQYPTGRLVKFARLGNPIFSTGNNLYRMVNRIICQNHCQFSSGTNMTGVVLFVTNIHQAGSFQCPTVNWTGQLGPYITDVSFAIMETELVGFNVWNENKIKI